MSYLQFKEKLYSLKNDEFQRQRVFERIQVYLVAGVWIAFTAVLLWHGRQKELRDRAAHRPPVIPEAVTVSQGRTPLPTTLYSKKR